MAFVVNQDDTTLTTLRLDGKFSPVVGTLSLGPAQADAIGGVTFSLGEWVFVTHTAGDRVAAIDPIGGSPPILEDFITTNPANALVRVGRRPTKIYRDPVDKEVLWTTNEGDPDGIDRLAGCTNGGSVSVLHNSHLGVGGGEGPRVTSKVCLSGKGEHFIAFSQPPLAPQEYVFVSGKTTGLISVLQSADGVAWTEFRSSSPSLRLPIDLCDSAKETILGHPVCDASTATPNHSAPAGMFWSQATGKIYSYLSGYGTVIEINPEFVPLVPRRVDVASVTPSVTAQHVGMAPDGRELLVIIEDRSNPDLVVTRFATIDVTVSGTLALTELTAPTLPNVRVAQFQFTPDGRRLYLLASNDSTGLSSTQAANQRKDLLVILDRNPLQVARKVSLPPATSHAMDLWITGPAGAGSAKGVVITNATPGVNGTVSLIDPNTGTTTATFSVGRNPKMVTVYYTGLAASDNQAMPRW
jgi:DNA-binding beta-propeller fold protein YncE